MPFTRNAANEGDWLLWTGFLPRKVSVVFVVLKFLKVCFWSLIYAILIYSIWTTPLQLNSRLFRRLATSRPVQPGLTSFLETLALFFIQFFSFRIIKLQDICNDPSKTFCFIFSALNHTRCLLFLSSCESQLTSKNRRVVLLLFNFFSSRSESTDALQWTQIVYLAFFQYQLRWIVAESLL